MVKWNGPPVLVATRSAGKLRELRPLFASLGVPLTDLEEFGLTYDPEEDTIERFDTFEENALAKARYFFEASGGIPTVADDSGLEVLALSGAPGVHSKRWARNAQGKDRGDGATAPESSDEIDVSNNAMLVRSVAELADRRARYVCAAAYVGSERELVRRGDVAGVIVTEPRGTQGFGYDPYFVADELGRTFGEATRDAKERVSHRARAFRALLDAIAAAAR
jgi:XTP/dITP diphosphohydrolase